MAALLTTSASAHPAPDDISIEARAGYSLGAATPVGIPVTIRHLDSYSLTPNALIGVDARLPLSDRWGLLAGLHFEKKGMDVTVTTKGYHMAMVKGGEELEGVYTGRVQQHTKAWMVSVPVMATVVIAPQWLLRAGPYVSVLTARDFSGNVSDGYLRKDTPTGQKIEMGHTADERATDDFSDSMRRLQMGVGVGADWHFASRLGLSADLTWGLTGIMKHSFKTVEQTLYPIYGTLSLTYRIK